MRELSIGDIGKLQENKRTTIHPNNIYRYLNGSSILYEKLILNDPLSATYIQLQNSDGTLDIVSENVKARNISVNGLSTLNKTRINEELLIKGNSVFQGNISCSQNINTDSFLTNELSVNNFATFNNIYVSNNVSSESSIKTPEIITNCINSNTSKLSIGEKEEINEITIGNINSKVNIVGNLKYNTVENDVVYNREFVLNGISGIALELPVNDVGIYFSNGVNNKKGYIKTDSSLGNTIEIKAPNSFHKLITPNLNSDATIVYSDNESKNVFLENLITLGDASLNNISVVSNATFTNISLNDLHSYGNIYLDGNIITSGTINFNDKLYTLNNDNHIYIDKLVATSVIIDGLNVSQANIQNLLTKNSNIEKSNIGECNISKANIDYCEISQIKNDEFVACNAKIDNLVVDSDMIINNLNVKRNAKVYGNEIIYGNLEAQNLQLANKAEIKTIESNSAKINHIETEEIKGTIVSSRHISSNTLNVCDKVYIGDKFIVSKDTDTIIHSSLKVNNCAHLESLGVSGDTNLTDLNITKVLKANRVNIQEDLNVSGDITAEKNLTILRNLNVFNESNFYNPVRCNSNVIINDNLNVKKELVADNAHVINGLFINDLHASNDISISGNCIISGESNFSNIKSSGNIVSSGNLVSNSNLYVNGYSELSRCIIKDGLAISGDVIVNDEPLINKKYLASIGTTFTYFSLDGTTYNYEYSIKNGLYTYIINGHTLNKTSSVGDVIKNNIYSIAVNIDNSIIIGGYLNTNRVLCKLNTNSNSWEDISLEGNIIDVIKCDPRGVIYYAGDFKENGRLYQYFPNSRIWNNIGKDITGQIKTIVFDSNYNVYIGGNITIFGDNPLKKINYIAKYNVFTNAWEKLNEGLNNIVNCLTIDTMDNLYVGGEFTNYLIRWNNQEKKWQSLGISLDRSVNCLGIDSNNLLYIGGRFFGNIARYNLDTLEIEYIRNGLIGDMKLIAIDSNDVIYISMTTAPYLFKWSEIDKKWIPCVKNINGLVSSLCFDKNDKLYIAGNFTVPHNKFMIFDSDNTKTVKFNNLIKYVDSNNNLISGKQIVFNKIAQTLTIKFEKNVGYILNKSECIQLTI
jgi:hypothetical protein